MAQAMGLIEICGIPAALVAADIMSKAAAVQVIGIENTDLARISVVIRGDTGAVQTALTTAVSELSRHSGVKVLGSHLLPCPANAMDADLPGWQTHLSLDNELEWIDD
ncbi:MAG: BMC domain-containing protein [Leptolyngbya sp. SIO1D8]|nr:BMC domain-containing protein [Leptolyngbya sp. SIO1D8]